MGVRVFNGVVKIREQHEAQEALGGGGQKDNLNPEDYKTGGQEWHLDERQGKRFTWGHAVVFLSHPLEQRHIVYGGLAPGRSQAYRKDPTQNGGSTPGLEVTTGSVSCFSGLY